MASATGDHVQFHAVIFDSSGNLIHAEVSLPFTVEAVQGMPVCHRDRCDLLYTDIHSKIAIADVEDRVHKSCRLVSFVFLPGLPH